jgi:hypothetical protein
MFYSSLSNYPGPLSRILHRQTMVVEGTYLAPLRIP